MQNKNASKQNKLIKSEKQKKTYHLNVGKTDSETVKRGPQRRSLKDDLVRANVNKGSFVGLKVVRLEHLGCMDIEYESALGVVEHSEEYTEQVMQKLRTRRLLH